MELFVVLQYKDGEHPNTRSEFQGIFSSEDKAISACRTPMYGYFRAIVDEECPHETFELKNFVYPKKG